MSESKKLYLTERIAELEKEYEKNIHRRKDLDTRQYIIECELTALKTMARDLLSKGIENTEL